MSMGHSSLSPIVLFVFDRLEHTMRTIQSLQNNYLADSSILYIYSDGPKENKNSVFAVQQVRDYILSITGFKKVNIIYNKTNKGLANSIISGVTDVISKHHRVIVLEDDIVTAPFFLKYMNDSLNKYCETEKVMSISGGNYPVDLSTVNSETFFLRIPLCWGWATWEDRWEKFNRDLSLVNTLSLSEVKYMNFDNSHNFFQQAELNLSGRLKTWFIFWYIVAVKQKMLTLFPKEKICMNIGFDGTGQNCQKSSEFQFEYLTYNNEIILDDIEVEENKQVFFIYKEFFLKIRKNIFKRILRRGKDILYGAFK
ncbi:hypothetical protein [Celerinatantimonas sp. MCCC 1A17872]|uniref:hypothetical protein n=1 Tax=Celerinatantimonas sp. MCCC 1A17872 TaxID=3177514 RepID=UPI0038BE8922